jgi:glycosyltransferase involved in cell wall biosynthesis
MAIDHSLFGATKVSIVMTIYNAELFLKDAVDSIVSQTFRDWELIAVENGSSDGSLSIIKSYNDKRIRLFALPENIGRTPALNFGCQKAVGEYIAILDADDLAERDRIKLQVEFMDTNQAIGMVAGWAKMIDQSGKITAYFQPPAYPALVNENLSWSMPIVHSTMLIRRSILLDECGGYLQRFDIGQDWDLCIRVAEKYPVCVLETVLGSWRRYPSSITGSSANFLKGRLEVLRILEYAQVLCRSKKSKNQNRRHKAINALACSYYFLLNLQVIDFIKYICSAFYADPLCLFANQKVKKMLGTQLPEYFTLL